MNLQLIIKQDTNTFNARLAMKDELTDQITVLEKRATFTDDEIDMTTMFYRDQIKRGVLNHIFREFVNGLKI